MKRRFPVDQGAQPWGWDAWIPYGLGALVLGLGLLGLDRLPNVDEMNHVLAARQYLANGTLEINGEPYVRARFFTYLVIGMMWLFGESLFVARLPSLIAGVGLVLLLYIFVRSHAGRLSAFLAALLLATAPITIYLSGTSRFYTLHAVAFLLAAMAVYTATQPERELRIRLTALILTVPPLLLAWHLQPITVVGLLALGVWLVLALGFELLTRVAPRRPRVASVGGGVALLVGLGIVGLVLSSEWFGGMWSLFRHAPPWAERTQDALGFYHRRYMTDYPSLWALLPLLFLLAGRARPRLTLFAGTVFFVAFATHSIAAWKNERFLFYTLPLFFTVCGIAAAQVVPWFGRTVKDMLLPHLHLLARPGTLLRPARWILATAAIMFFLATTPAFRASARLLSGSPESLRMTRGYGETPAWAAAAQSAASVLDASAVVVSVTLLPPLYHFGRVDFTIHESPGRSFDVLEALDLRDRQGVGVIRTPEALERVLACFPSGVAIVEEVLWRVPTGVTPEMADRFEALTEPVRLPADSGLMGFRWGEPIHPERCERPPPV